MPKKTKQQPTTESHEQILRECHQVFAQNLRAYSVRADIDSFVDSLITALGEIKGSIAAIITVVDGYTPELRQIEHVDHKEKVVEFALLTLLKMRLQLLCDDNSKLELLCMEQLVRNLIGSSEIVRANNHIYGEGKQTTVVTLDSLHNTKLKQAAYTGNTYYLVELLKAAKAITEPQHRDRALLTLLKPFYNRDFFKFCFIHDDYDVGNKRYITYLIKASLFLSNEALREEAALNLCTKFGLCRNILYDGIRLLPDDADENLIGLYVGILRATAGIRDPGQRTQVLCELMPEWEKKSFPGSLPIVQAFYNVIKTIPDARVRDELVVRLLLMPSDVNEGAENLGFHYAIEMKRPELLKLFMRMALQIQDSALEIRVFSAAISTYYIKYQGMTHDLFTRAFAQDDDTSIAICRVAIQSIANEQVRLSVIRKLFLLEENLLEGSDPKLILNFVFYIKLDNYRILNFRVQETANIILNCIRDSAARNTMLEQLLLANLKGVNFGKREMNYVSHALSHMTNTTDELANDELTKYLQLLINITKKITSADGIERVIIAFGEAVRKNRSAMNQGQCSVIVGHIATLWQHHQNAIRESGKAAPVLYRARTAQRPTDDKEILDGELDETAPPNRTMLAP